MQELLPGEPALPVLPCRPAQSSEAGRRWRVVLNLGVVKVEHTRRGWRVGIGPRWFRRWYGAGGRGTSTGIGPFSTYRPDRRNRRSRG